ncbi:MAG: HlyC/CorC family transporter [Betaproteobacteria bacterium]
MEDVALEWLFGILALLLVGSGFFSISETSMMAINRYRLKHLMAQGDGGARRVAELLRHTDRLLGAILIGNNLVNAAAATLAGVIAVRLFGDGKLAYGVSTVGIAFLLIVFSEITPKVIGATHPERIALPLSYLIGPLQRLLQPGVWFVNLFVKPLLWALRIKPAADPEAQKLSPEEIRTLVLESSSFMPKKHVSMLLNLFDIQEITVQDVMVPRARIEAIRLDEGVEDIARQLTTSYHRHIPVYRSRSGNDGDEIAGVLQMRKVVGLLASGALDKAALEALLDEPYYVPASTPVIAQLQYFQENQERIALVVDEYGELMGLAALEDIVEEIVGKFTTSLPTRSQALAWDADGVAAADGAMSVREVNRVLGLELPIDGPKTLNGLILEQLQDIPEANVSMKIAGVPMEIVHAQGRSVKTVRLFRPREEAPPEPGQAS